MIGDARERGYITYDQLNTVLPPDQVSSDQIEDVMSMLSEMGIQVTEEHESEEEEDKGLNIKTDDEELIYIPYRKVTADVFVKRQAKGKCLNQWVKR
jgi:hypothetical protein